ncbi:EamA family transporter [Variovorax boronicumulans]|uniref:EamA family transporter n=1 Tax=Variovorax boronicumulans TaxID=436515 RepID=A0A250DNJ0_9BURK|nr:DMT family transporter [Variovorax boronicumulans]ATA55559.1 EamA family transporter [Variovorax boronicumulans]
MTRLSASPPVSQIGIDRRWVGVLFGLASALIWGAFPVVTRFGLTHTALDVYDITCIRYTVSGVMLLPFLVRRGLMGLRWTSIALMTAGIGAPYMLVVAFGLGMAPVEQFAVVTPGSMILFSALISAWGLGARLSRRETAGIALIILGVALVGFHNFSAVRSSPWAYLIFLLGGLLWAIYTVSSKQFSASALHATAIVSVFSMIIYLPAYLATRGLHLLQAPLGDIGVQAFYQGVMVSTVALFFFSKSVQILGAAVGATFAALVPGAATLLALLVLDERPSATAIAGLVIVTGGMTAMLIQQRRSSSPAESRGT